MIEIIVVFIYALLRINVLLILNVLRWPIENSSPSFINPAKLILNVRDS